MKTLMLRAALISALTAGSALAADLPNKKAPAFAPPPPPPLWTGFYVGLNAGSGWSQSNSVSTAALHAFNNGARGAIEAGPIQAAAQTTNIGVGDDAAFIGGGQIGYNLQLGALFVAGLEADIQGVAGDSSSRSESPPAFSAINGPLLSVSEASKRLDYIGTVRGRFGFLAAPTLLAYATFGLAYGQTSASASNFQIFPTPVAANFGAPHFSTGNYSDTRAGWTAGGGVEWMFLPNWSAKIEYLYYDLGEAVFAQSPNLHVLARNNAPWTLNFLESRTRFNGHIVRAGVNYHFSWGALPAVPTL
jgi:outer membrane immunogenic protein